MNKADVEKLANRLAAGRRPTREESEELIQLALTYLDVHRYAIATNVGRAADNAHGCAGAGKGDRNH
jgi:hypothetical protein